ncbi:hypothetical protein D6C87_03941 [Aureobasidium pullulans]|uniref:NAD(P)-binding protein n=1 Tax=Aureobasidium pullulans TaxID=5580 RepID=A0AB38LSF0_AURPU|nr:hypothetical protein D6C94_07915 [Aureobasidium pullulans]THZ43953.1 hypothetical protein D6C87_03941 [Aureobasidium pullulans]
MAAGFNVIAAIREKVDLAFFDALVPFSCEKAFGHVVENETKAEFSASAVSHVDDGFNVIDAVIWFVVASFNAVVIIVDVAVDVAVRFRLPGPGKLACDIAVGGPSLLISSDSLLLLGKERKTKQAKGFKHHETRGSRTFINDKHLCRTRCLHWASLHGPLKPIERHDGSEFTSIVQEEQAIGLLHLIVAFFTKYSVHSDDQSDRHLRS